MNVANFLSKAFSREHRGWRLLYLFEEKEEESVEQRKDKKIQKKEENENISFNFYQKVLVLVATEMQIKLYKYSPFISTHPSSIFCLEIFFLLLPVC